MKGLKQFESFDLSRFLADKTLVVTAIGDWVDYNTKAVCGKKVTCAITRDDTMYTPSKNGQPINNLFEKFDVKITSPNTVNVAIGDEVIVPADAMGSIYGDFGDKLSIKASGLMKKAEKTKA